MIQFTTRNRPHVLEYSLKKTREVYDGFIIVIDDCSDTSEANKQICKRYDTAYSFNEKRRGIPRSKERGFRSLLSFSRQFWLDDDCFLKHGWYERIIEAQEFQPHLLHLREWAFIKRKRVYPQGIVSFTGATACFMSFTRDQYKDIHGFQAGFTKYGHWHSRLSQKMAKYGVDEYVAIERSEDYIHSFDVDGIPADFDYHFQSSMSKEERQTELKNWKA